jgi:hypothetical protein
MQPVLSGKEPASELEVVETPDGAVTGRYGGRYLHPRREPLGRARAALTDEWVREHPVVVFYGFGFGYEVEAFLSRSDAEAAVVVEPDAVLFHQALSRRDLRHVLSAPQATFLVAANPETLAMVLRRFERRAPERYALNASVRVHEEYFQRVDAVLEAARNRARINANTLRRFGRLWVRNLIRNVGMLERAPGVRKLSGAFDGIPALLCAAGPSLDLALEHIQSLSQRALIVAVDTALPALLQRGVEPDFAVVVDPQYWNTRHLDRVSTQSTVFVSEASAHPRVFRQLSGPFYLCSSIFPLGEVLEGAVGPKGKLGTGGSVSTTAWDLARMLGAHPIYCIGLDLGFPDRRTHVRGSFFEERSHLLALRTKPAEEHSFEYLHDAEPFEVRANDGGNVLTDRRMMIYTWWFSNQARIHTETETVNLSPGGVAVDGLTAGDIDNLQQRPERPAWVETRLEKLRRGAREITPVRKPTTASRPSGPEKAGDGSPLWRAVEELADGLETFARTAREGINLVDALSVMRNPDLSRLDAIDRRLAQFEYRDVAGFLMQEVADRVQGRSGDRSASAALESARILYEGVVDAAEYHIRLLRLAPELAAADVPWG